MPRPSHAASRRHLGSLFRGFEMLECRRLLAGDSVSPRSDHYRVTQDQSLHVPAEMGVLANDQTVELGAVSAALVSRPAHGLVQLASDGSFRYEPDLGYTGTDRFSYLVDSGATKGLATTVTLVVQRPEALRIRPRGDSVVTFNEVMYHPLERGDAEWIELHNQMSVNVDLSGWKIEGGVEFEFAPGTVLRAGGYRIVAAQPDDTAFRFALDDVWGPLRGRLSNGGEEIRLVNNSGRVMDVLDYRDRDDWPVGPDGSGATLAKRHPNAATSDASGWVASPQLDGTPGGPNFGDSELRQIGLISSLAPVTVHVPPDDSLGITWTDPQFDDSSWIEGNQPLWFDTAAPADAPASGSLKAYWPFDGDFNDVTGNDHAARPTGTRFDDDAPTALERGQSIWLDGEDDFVSAVVDVSETSYSASMWFRADAANVQDPSFLNRGLFSVVTTDLAPQANNDRQIFFSGGNAVARVWFSETIRSTELSLSDGNWHHVVHVLGEDVGGQRLYVDGQLVAEGSKTSSDVNSQTRVNIGFAYSGRNRFYRGWVDDVSLWDEALGAEAVQALYNGTSPLSLPSYRSDVGTHLAAQMAGVQSTAYVRSEFVANAGLYGQLQLHAQYDDGFVAYLNGLRVAEVNAPSELTWNAAATANRLRREVLSPEIIDLTPHLDLLRTGRNVLAVQALNSAASVEDFLLSAQLVGRVREFTPLLADLKLSEVSGESDTDFSVEIFNAGGHNLSLGGLVLSSTEGDGRDFALPPLMLAAGEYRTFIAAETGFLPNDGDRLFLYAPQQRQVIDAVAIQSHPQARLGDDKRWLTGVATTPNAPNQVFLHDEILINEIHYHDAPYYATESLPFIESPTEWIELYNRSPLTIDLSGWLLAGGIRFEFPTGTTLASGQYMVVANDAAALALDFPHNTILGNFAGALNNEHDTVQLLDESGNLADEVTYFEGGRWPQYADGGGATLELRDPLADNLQPEAWAASNETERSPWQTVTYRGVVADDGFSERSAQLFHEFVFGLLDAGELLIDDISVIEDPGGARIERIQNGSFQQDQPGSSPDKWRIAGNHQGIVVSDPDDFRNQTLHVTASGPMEDRLNHAETTFSDAGEIRVGTEYEISFRAKWLGGSPQLNTHLYFNHLAKTTVLQVPRPSGTPGRQNSRFSENIGPTYAGLKHSPVVPDPNQDVAVHVVATDPQAVAELTLWFAVDDGTWQSVNMIDAGNDHYQGTIPEQAAAKVVQFYVEGIDTEGAVSFFPAEGRRSRALYQVQDGQSKDGLLQSFRLIMTPADTARLLEDTNLSSNGRIGGTVVSGEMVSGETEVFYDVGVRLKGSSAGRTSGLYLSFNVQFDPMQLFRGVHRTVGIDRSGRSRLVSRGQDEILVKHIANQAGVPAMFDDLTHFIAPDPKLSQTALLMLARYGDIFLDSQFANGADGTVFKLDIPYIPEGTVDGDPESPKLPFPYQVPQPSKDMEDLGDDKELYRTHLLIRNNRSADDYRQMIAVSQALSLEDDALAEATAKLIDLDQWARLFAVQSLTGTLDTYTSGNLHHNIAFYVRPEDGRVLALPWDWDVSFTLINSGPLIYTFSNTAKLLHLPANRRLVYGHLLDIMNTTFNNAYLDAWIDHYGQVAGSSFRAIKEYVQLRSEFVRSELPEIVNFEVTTSSGEDFETKQPTVTLEGTAWIDIREIRLADSTPPLDVIWTGEDTWQLSLPLSPGSNSVELQAYDFAGNLVGEDALVINNTGEEQPSPITLRVSEIHFNPAPPSVHELAAGHTNNDDFEFLELVNIGNEAADLRNVQLVQMDVGGRLQGIAFDFATAAVTTLPAGGHVLVVEDTEAFTSRYGHGLPVAGQWRGGLANGGELLSLVADGIPVQQFAYDDQWYPQADGDGFSLEVVDPAHPDLETWAVRQSWRPSIIGGTPGLAATATRLRGDFNLDQVVNANDIDLMFAEIRTPGHPLRFDLTNDGLVNERDIEELVTVILDTRFGDVNLDGVVDRGDFAVLHMNFGSARRSWSAGNFDGDNDVDFHDFGILAINFTDM